MNKDIETYHVKNSTLMLRADYDNFMGNLKIYFRSGEVYDFVGVPRELYEELKNAKSAGKYFHSKIKPSYDHLKLTKKTKELMKASKKAKKIIMEKFGDKPWFKGANANNKEERITIYLTDVSNIESIKNSIPSELNIEFDFKVVNK